MHLNPQHPNILADMQAAVNGRDLRDGQRMPFLHDPSRVMVLPTAKRHLIPRKTYHYASERQTQRQQANYIVISAKRRYRDFRQYRQAETQG